jgi:uncharacterized protein YndB with AHSA1/START domain
MNGIETAKCYLIALLFQGPLKHAVIARRLFVCSALLLLFANAAHAARYQRTKDGQTRVWNNLRGWAEEAAWSGDRDADGYATGEGTLTWYQVERKLLTGSNIPSGWGPSFPVSSYSGKMVRGKFDGPVVSTDAYGKKLYANFADGNKVSDWVAEPAPKPTATPKERPAPLAASAEQPAPVAASVKKRKPSPADQKRKEDAVVEAPTENSSLDVLSPPSRLRTTVAAAGSPQAFMPPAPSSPAAKSPANTIHQEVDFKASPGQIYDALLDAKQFSAFSGRPAEITREVGGAFSLFGGHIIGRNMELVPNQRIVQVWRVVTWPEGVYSMVRFDLKAEGSGTHLVFEHTGFPEGERDHLAEGWESNYWALLKKYLP